MPMPRRIMGPQLSTGVGDMDVIISALPTTLNFTLGVVDASGKVFTSGEEIQAAGTRKFNIARYNESDLAFESMKRLNWGLDNDDTRCFGITLLANGNLLTHGRYRFGGGGVGDRINSFVEVNPTTLVPVRGRYVNHVTRCRYSDSFEYNGNLFMCGTFNNQSTIMAEKWDIATLSLQAGYQSSDGEWTAAMVENGGNIFVAGFKNDQYGIIIKTDSDYNYLAGRKHYIVSSGSNRYDGITSVGTSIFACGRMEYLGVSRGFIRKMAAATLLGQGSVLLDVDSVINSVCSDGSYIYAVGGIGNEGLIEKYDLSLNRVLSYKFSNTGIGTFTIFRRCIFRNGRVFTFGNTDQLNGITSQLVCSFDLSNPISVPYSPPCLPAFTLQASGVGDTVAALTELTTVSLGAYTPSLISTTVSDNVLTPTNTGPC